MKTKNKDKTTNQGNWFESIHSKYTEQERSCEAAKAYQRNLDDYSSFPSLTKTKFYLLFLLK